MAIRNVVLRGYGPGGSIAFVVTRGYSIGAALAEPEGMSVSAVARVLPAHDGTGMARPEFVGRADTTGGDP